MQELTVMESSTVMEVFHFLQLHVVNNTLKNSANTENQLRLTELSWWFLTFCWSNINISRESNSLQWLLELLINTQPLPIKATNVETLKRASFLFHVSIGPRNSPIQQMMFVVWKKKNWGINAQNHWFAEENVWCFLVCFFLLQQCDLVGKDKGVSKWQNEKRKAEEKKVDFSSLGGATPSAKTWPFGRSFYLAKQTCTFFKW